MTKVRAPAGVHSRSNGKCVIGVQAALLLGCAAQVLAAGERAENALLSVRLMTALTSYGSEAGSEFRSVVIAPYLRDGRVFLPQGTTVYGVVAKTNSVGLGVIRERASMELEFREYELPDGRRFPFEGKLRRIDNARETVDERGQIRGILAANGPQSFVHGVWHTPRPELLSRSFIGLTGAGGKIFTAYSMGPVGAAGLFAVRCALFRMPEPEIRLPAGAEMKVMVMAFSQDAPSFEPEQEATLDADLEAWLAARKPGISRPDGMPARDMINVAFTGLREELENAFRAAGWTEAERKSTRTISRTYNAFSAQTGYASAPVSRLLYGGAEPDVVFQKSFNTISKRHHIRLWRVDAGGLEVWLGAATHDTGVEFDRTVMTFTHRIHSRIDFERAKVVNDLTFAGCAGPAAYVARPAAVRGSDDPRDITTDGRLAVVSLRNGCRDVSDEVDSQLPQLPGTRAGRMARRMMLEGKQYALRGNAYYLTYRVLFQRRAEERRSALLDD